MLTADQAIGRITAEARPTQAETVPLGSALGRVLVDPRVRAPIDVPPFANSSMDGFALRAADAPGALRLVGEAGAGAAHLPRIAAGTTARIMTGAPLPPGADAVVPLEMVTETDELVTVPAVEVGSHVRGAGHDTAAGDEVVLAGGLTPSGIAVLASLGIAQVTVHRAPRVAVLSTGDELVPPGGELGPGQIYDANSAALAAAIVEAGGEPIPIRAARDAPDEIERRLREAAQAGEVVITSGGVSVGRRDHVRDALERLGTLDFWRIAVQPGKPLAFGELDGRPVLGLPGNPVSALVTFELFGRPLLRAMLGLVGDGRTRLRARPTSAIGKDRDREAYLRVVVRTAPATGASAGASAPKDPILLADPAGGQQSSQLRPLAAANALLVVPAREPAASPDRDYTARMLGPVR